MSCCDPGEQKDTEKVEGAEEKKNNEKLDDEGNENESERDKGTKNIWALGLGVVLVVGLLVMTL